MRKLILGALLTLAVMPVHAAETQLETLKRTLNSANYMLPYCKLTTKEVNADTNNAMLWGRCSGIVDSITEVFNLLKEMQGKGEVQLPPLLCADIPKGVTTQQAINVIAKFAETNPEITHQPFMGLAFAVIPGTWPCK